MKCLIVTTHPLSNSLCKQLTGHVVNKLAAMGHEVLVEDLYADDFGPIKPRLENLRKVLVITTLGAPWWVDRLIMWQPVKRVIKVALLGACTRESKLKYLSL